MAYAKCSVHGPHIGRTIEYIAEPVKPIGFPNAAVICAIGDCQNPALVYLTSAEWIEYQAGKRTFRFPRECMKIGVADPDISN